MVEKDFYISLPSNASLNEYPKNTQSNYTTLLDTPIELSSKYMVCLKEISNFSDFNVSMGTVSFQNVFFTALELRKSDVNFNFFIKNGTNLQQFCDSINTEITKNFLKQEYLIRYKLAYTSELNRACSDLNYKKKEAKIPKFNLIKKINQNLLQTPILPTFKYQNSNRIEIDSSFSKLKINGLLANFLNNSKITEMTLKTKESFYLPTKIHPTKFIVIYSDIIEPQFYGNIKSPILRTVNIRSENDENTVYFDNPHYLNVNRTRIDTINIQLCDLAGKHIQFRDNFSSIHLTLHFKKKE